MSVHRTSTRRAFLKGRAAADALVDLADSVARQAVASSPKAEARSPAARPSGYLLRVGRRAMACPFQVVLQAGEHARGTAAAVAALDRIDELENQLTVYRDDSEVMHLNRRAADEPVVVEEKLFELLRLAQRLWRDTEGAFDITAGPLTKVWGFFRRQGRIPDERDLAAALACVGSGGLQLDERRRTVRFGRMGMEINLGAIGKGYALDRAAEVLAAEGVHRFLFHGGQSSVVARGSCGHGGAEPGWLVGLAHPLRPRRRLAELRLCDRALGTSGSGTQFFRHRGRRYGHVLDPRSGRPAEGVLSATVLAPTAAEADALSTALYVMGARRGLEFCRDRPELAAVFVLPAAGGDVQIIATGFQQGEFRELAGR